MYTIKRNWALVAGCIALFQGVTTAQAQDNSTKSYDKWSVEVNVGQSKGIKPYSVGYYSSNPKQYFNFSGVNHFDLGVRYMFNTKFGFKVDAAMDKLSDESGSGSLAFKTQQMRFGFQGVVNLGRMLDFESFTNRFNILGHAGLQVSQFSVKEGLNKDITEDNGGIMVGLTPQLRLTNWLVLTGDFTAINNVRQHLAWDGNASGSDNNLSGVMFNTSLGFTVYLGKQEKHADWYTEVADKASKDNDARQRLDALEGKMVDTDNDGVADYLDIEKNSPKGSLVNTQGKAIDSNNNGIPDNMDTIVAAKAEGKDGKDGKEGADGLKSLVEKGLLNIFYDVNKDEPNVGSTNNVYQTITYLRAYPDAKIKLIGYADAQGNEKANLDLSKRRANKLYNIIVAGGVDASRISVDYKGVEKFYPTDSKMGLELARRVSITVVK